MIFLLLLFEFLTAFLFFQVYWNKSKLHKENYFSWQSVCFKWGRGWESDDNLFLVFCFFYVGMLHFFRFYNGACGQECGEGAWGGA